MSARPRGRWLRPFVVLSALVVVLIPIIHTRPIDPETAYDQARQAFIRGQLETSQLAAQRGYRQFQGNNPEWATEFQLLDAEIALRRGMADEALQLLAAHPLPSQRPKDIIRKLTIESTALARLQELTLADQKLKGAEALCKAVIDVACGEVSRSRGVLDVSEDHIPGARLALLDALAVAKANHDSYLAATVELNLGWLELQQEHFDDSIDWSSIAYRNSIELGSEDLAQNISGNLGWAYFQLGDLDRALQVFTDAERLAARLGNIRSEVTWLMTVGNVYQQERDFTHAEDSFKHALALARSIHSKQDIVNSLEDLAHTSIDAGNIDAAADYVNQLDPLVRASGNRLDILDTQLAQARIAAARHQDHEAEALFRIVEHDPESQASMRLAAEHELARMYESTGDATQTERTYRKSLATFESARDQLKSEDNKLPFLANASPIYDDYIHFLITQGREEEALYIADQSRAQTLAQGLGVAAKSNPLKAVASHPASIARKANATILFYWLGEKQSYLWAIAPTKTSLFPLPPHREIAQALARYRKTLLGFRDPLENVDADGLALYRMLVAPASASLRPAANVVLLTDDELSQFNFETLIVPGPRPHYWIDDANVISAPSLQLLAAENSSAGSTGKLLLLGDAVSPNPDYPELPMAATEMKEVEQHFPAPDQTVYARERATASAYLASNPRQFAYIHFVAHGVASRTDPLDSAIILSRESAAEDSFKLHARDIIQHPLNASLVTISACYGSGTRSYAGEGSVGLAWAFLRAGAHHVIGALWEANDESTAQLMGDLYQNLSRGIAPSAALRQAKLNLLHSKSEFHKPFYWAPLQVYTGR